MKNTYSFKAKATATAITVLLAVTSGFAQTRVSGTVKDVDNELIPGVSVQVVNTVVGTVTDIDGKYSIVLPANSSGQLAFSFVGFESETVDIGDRTIIDVVLREAAVTMEEVVVVGYGTMLKSDITGSVSSVRINENEASSVTSFDRLLQGSVAGVQVISGSGAPGGAVEIVIRGASSFNSSSEPLYVVDGIILNPSGQDVSNPFSGGAQFQERQNTLSTINPKDIQSMEILKDASATAIYGSMGANGVVLITTKQGNSSKPKIEYSSTFHISQVNKSIPMLDMEGFAAWRKEMWEVHEQGQANLRIDPDTTVGINWQNFCMREPLSQTHKLSVSGKTESTTYFISGSYTDNNGLVKRTGVKIGNLRMNLDKNLGKAVKVGTRTTFSYTANSMTQGNEASGNINNSMLRQMTLYRPYLTNTRTDDEDYDPDNENVTEGPQLWFDNYDDISRDYRMVASLYGEITIVKGITFKSTFGADYRRKYRFRSYGMGIQSGRDFGGRIGMSFLNSLRYNWDNNLNLNYTFNKIHRVTGMLGFSVTESNTENNALDSQTFPTMDWSWRGASLGTSNFNESYSTPLTSMVSYMARGTYSYRDKYILTATFRADGSSKFAKENRYSYFPSFAFAWRVNQERFMEAMSSVSNLKLRVGWGATGNQGAVSPYQTISTYGIGRYASTRDITYVGYRPTTMTNPLLKWETTHQTNLGADVSFFKNRLNITVDVYQKDTRDLLQQITIPGSTGFTQMWVNRGGIRNKGLEFSVDGIIVRSKDFTWSAAGNIYFNRNTITDTGLELETYGKNTWRFFEGTRIGNSDYVGMPANIFIEGKPMALFFGLQTRGIVQEGEQDEAPWGYARTAPSIPGDVYFVDQTGDGIIDDTDRVIIGDPNPKFAGGFSTGVSWKGLSLDVNMNGVYGKQVLNANLSQENNVGQPTTLNNNNIRTAAYYEAWRPEAPSEKYPALCRNPTTFAITDRLVEDGSFLRLANVTLSYRFKIKPLPAISNIVLSVSGNNLFCWTNYSGWDPEVSSFPNDPLRVAIDWISYPNYRTYIFGINVTF